MSGAENGSRVWEATRGRVEILVALSRLFTDPHDGPEAAMGAAAAVLTRGMRDGVAIELLAADGGSVIPIALDHPRPATRRLLQERIGRGQRADEGFTERVLETGMPLLIPRVTVLEIRALQPDLAPVCEAIGVRGFIGAPLVMGGRLRGIVWQIRTRAVPILCGDDQRFLQEVAARLACALATWAWTPRPDRNGEPA